MRHFDRDSSTIQEHVFQSFWIGPRLSPLEHLCIKSFLTHGHTFVLYSYDDVKNVPRGCVVEDARQILGESNVFMLGSGIHIGTPSTFSDRFRYELLRARGGWWVDTDVLCLKDEIADTPYVFAKEDEHTYNGAVLKAPPGSAFLSRASARCMQATKDTEYSAIGPALVDDLVRELGLERYAWAREDVYPLPWQEALDFFDPAQADRIEALVASSTFVHFFTNMLRLANVLKDVRPPQSSYLDRLYVTYNIDFPTSRRYGWAELQAQYAFQKEQRTMRDQLALLRAEVQQLRSDHECTTTSSSPPVASRATIAAAHPYPEPSEMPQRTPNVISGPPDPPGRDGLAARNASTPSWLLPPPIRRLREHVRTIRRLTSETNRQVIDARQQTVESLAGLGVRVAQVETLAQQQIAELSRIAAQIEELVAESPLTRQTGRAPPFSRDPAADRNDSESV